MKNTRHIAGSLSIIAMFVTVLGSNKLAASELYYIDAHSQIDHKVGRNGRFATPVVAWDPRWRADRRGLRKFSGVRWPGLKKKFLSF
ncbi:MAG: hypothetical protein IH796_11025 [Deltaproteobacteria bacterium]|nr:hypothetical protein [Deltaproteobacteria bacterium]